jgi:hypothetical protein
MGLSNDVGSGKKWGNRLGVERNEYPLTQIEDGMTNTVLICGS